MNMFITCILMSCNFKIGVFCGSFSIVCFSHVLDLAGPAPSMLGSFY